MQYSDKLRVPTRKEVFFHAPYSHANNVAPSIPRSVELKCKLQHYFPDLNVILFFILGSKL